MNSFPGLALNRTAGGTINPYRIVAPGSTELVDVQASAATDALMGVNGPLTISSGERYDCAVSGLVPVEYGGDIERGDPLTSDSVGRAIKATVADQRIIGYAWEDGDSGTIGSALLTMGLFQSSTATLAAASVTLADAAGKYTATNVEAALAEVKIIADAPPASSVTVADAGNKFTGTNVETVLAELEARIAAVET